MQAIQELGVLTGHRIERHSGRWALDDSLKAKDESRDAVCRDSLLVVLSRHACDPQQRGVSRSSWRVTLAQNPYCAPSAEGQNLSIEEWSINPTVHDYRLLPCVAAAAFCGGAIVLKRAF
jgi:hypothetical protein